MSGPTIEAVLAIARQVPIFPCRVREEWIEKDGARIRRGPKSPYTETGFKAASQDQEQLRQWHQRYPGCLWGVPTGSLTKLIAIDYDPGKATQETQDWIAEHTDVLMGARIHTTGRNGRHYLYRASNGAIYGSGADIQLGGKKRPGLDLRAEGGYIIWWPLAGLHEQGTAPELPESLLAERAFRIDKGARTSLPPSPERWARDEKRVAEALAYLDPAGYDAWIHAGISIHHASVGGDSGFALWHAWSSGDITGSQPHSYSGLDICRDKWESFGKPSGDRKPRGLGSLFDDAKEAGWKPKVESAQSDDPGPTDNDPRGKSWDPPEQDGWGAPLDIWVNRPVAPVDIGSLPSSLHDYVSEVSELMGTDPTVLGLSSLVVCASVIDDRIQVQPKSKDTGWTEPARLWGVVVGNPSAKKSPAMSAAMKPLKAIEARLAEAHRDEMREFDEAFARHQRSRSHDKGSPPQKPCSVRTYTSNATVESLSDILQDNPQGILCFADELSSWFGSMDAYAKGNANKDKGLWLEAYNGGAQRIDRVTRGHIFVPNWSVNMLGGIQPDTFRNVAKKLENDGLLQRFMIVMAAKAKGDIDREPRDDVIREYYHLIHRLRDWRPSSEIIFRLQPEAQEVRRYFMTAIDGAQNSMLPKGMESYLGKWSGLFGRLLCAYHCIESWGAGRAPEPLIEAETAIRVVAFMEGTLYPHAYQFYSEQVGESDSWEHVRWIAGHILAKQIQAFATRDLVQAYRVMRALSDHQKAAALTCLADIGWIRGKQGSRVTGASRCPTQWEVNPVVHETFNERRRIEVADRARKMEQLQQNVDEQEKRK